MVVVQGGVYWVDLGEPIGSEPGFVRPVVVVQGDRLNRSRLRTVVCVALTSNLKWAEAPGNVLLPAKLTGLPKDSAANVTQIITVDRDAIVQSVSTLPGRHLEQVLLGIDLVMDR